MNPMVENPYQDGSPQPTIIPLIICSSCSEGETSNSTNQKSFQLNIPSQNHNSRFPKPETCSGLEHHSIQQKDLSSKQQLHFILQNCGIKINLDETPRLMKEIFLHKFPTGTNMMNGLLSSSKKIKAASISKLNEGAKKWIEIEGIQTVSQEILKFVQQFPDHLKPTFQNLFLNQPKSLSQNIIVSDQVYGDEFNLNSNQNFFSKKSFKSESKDISNRNDIILKCDNEAKSFVKSNFSSKVIKRANVVLFNKGFKNWLIWNGNEKIDYHISTSKKHSSISNILTDHLFFSDLSNISIPVQSSDLEDQSSQLINQNSIPPNLPSF
jgi:hypothetical protein